jgi:hypothetical protein
MQDDDVIEQFSAQGADLAFGERVLSWRAGSRLDFFEAERGKTTARFLPVDAVIVAEDVPGLRPRTEGFAELRSDPGRMRFARGRQSGRCDVGHGEG